MNFLFLFKFTKNIARNMFLISENIYDQLKHKCAHTKFPPWPGLKSCANWLQCLIQQKHFHEEKWLMLRAPGEALVAPAALGAVHGSEFPENLHRVCLHLQRCPFNIGCVLSCFFVFTKVFYQVPSSSMTQPAGWIKPYYETSGIWRRPHSMPSPSPRWHSSSSSQCSWETWHGAF